MINDNSSAVYSAILEFKMNNHRESERKLKVVFFTGSVTGTQLPTLSRQLMSSFC